MAAAEEGKVIPCHTEDEFDAQMARANEAGNLVVIDFMSPGCGPCIELAPLLAELAKKYPTILFLEVDVNELPEVASRYDVRATPTVVLTMNGKIIEILATVDAAKLRDTMHQGARRRRSCLRVRLKEISM